MIQRAQKETTNWAQENETITEGVIQHEITKRA